jgi:hypothetical protein
MVGFIGQPRLVGDCGPPAVRAVPPKRGAIMSEETDPSQGAAEQERELREHEREARERESEERPPIERAQQPPAADQALEESS